MFLDVDGAMSYATVWLNGKLVGGWPYGYNSFRLDLTPWAQPGGVNQLVIRLDNPPESARWYPGSGPVPQGLADEDGAGACGPLGHNASRRRRCPRSKPPWTWKCASTTTAPSPHASTC